MLRRYLKWCAISLAVFVGCVYALLWLFSLKDYDVSFGLSYSPEYAQSLGLDWKTTYLAILDDLKPRYIRLAVPWSRVEHDKGVYTFADVDFLMNEADKHGTKVVLAFGQKVPRWPECYIPEWLKTTAVGERKRELFSYIETVIKRYEGHSALEYWQVENEPFIKFAFGDCQIFDETSIKGEVNFVRSLDSGHKIVVTDSGELSTWQSAANAGDVLGVTLYRKVRTPGGMLISYGWVPSSVYKIRAYLAGKEYKNFFVSELQAEPWFTDATPENTPITVQEQTSSLAQISSNVSYAKSVGASRAYLWGVEWWYWMKTVKNDSKYWDAVKTILNK